MSYRIRRSHERKFFDHGWLKTHHTFSFGSYYDPHFMGFRDLRVINEDRVDPQQGFPLHDHQDMEILSIVLEGELGHQDSLGSKSVIHANEVQAMSAGSGITHSEFNPSKIHPVHFLQIWIKPNKKGIAPRYQMQSVTLPAPPTKGWRLLASPDGRDNSLKIQQDVELFAIAMQPGEEIEHEISKDRYGWIQVIEGDLSFDHDSLKTGDGIAIEPETPLKLKAKTNSRLLFFNLK